MPPILADILFVATSATYLAASVLFVHYLVGAHRPRSAAEKDAAAKEPPRAVTKHAPRLVLAGALLHAASIVVSSFVPQADGRLVCPVEGVHFAMSVVSMFVCILYLALRTRFHIDVVGAFVAPLALTFLLASRFVPSEPPSRLKSALLPFHILANLMGVAFFTLAFAAAVAYLLQERRLKKKKLEGVFQRLPPLDSLDRAEHRFLLAGFPLLTIGILTGTLWARSVEFGNASDIARAAFGYVSWLLFAAVLLLRAAAGWRGRRAAYGTIAGFGSTVLVLVIYVWRGAVALEAVTAMGAQ
jgi:ABC-type uncharacterized transport system permease subunit